MATIFSKIIAGEIPSYRIHEDERYFAFLDINPLAEGHTLVIPKVETDYLFDLEDDLLAGMTVFAKKVALAIDQVMVCKRVGVAVLGLEVPHAHIHLIPINNLHDIEFSRPKLKFSEEEFRATAAKISAAIQ
ncbi:MAG: HIT family protein [Bacteroidetes bacterium]|nr:MAG: HIT family protein [Bacteroidota bacterium]RLD72805.1 MAG: HIT family protein [Bacteroidota bacterium]RLD95205.1 MAG: HIT family protein [Bacteroidota bacterium]